MVIVGGSQYTSWNAGLTAGFWSYFVGTLVTALAFLCLSLCLAEMMGTLPFSGGAYGFVRLSISPYFGFIIGVLDIVQTVMYVTSNLIPFGQLCTIIFQTYPTREPYWWLVCFFVSSVILLKGGRIMIWFNRFLGSISLGILLIYICLAFPYGDYNKYVLDTSNASDGASFMFALPQATWFFIGIEASIFAGVDCDKSKETVPRGLVSCMVTLIVTASAVLLSSCSQYPGTSGIVSANFPFNYAFQNAFGVSPRVASVFSLPATYAAAYGFLYAFQMRLTSIEASGLLPDIFIEKLGIFYSRFIMYMMNLSFTFFCALGIWLFQDPTIIGATFKLGFISTYIVYIFILLSYIVFKIRYKDLPRKFRNSYGYSIATAGIFCFALCGAGVIGFDQATHYVSLSMYVAFLVISTIYYYAYGHKYERFSKEEQKILLVAYAINSKFA